MSFRGAILKVLVVAIMAGGSLLVLGCGDSDPVPQISPDSEQYKEAKRRGDLVRAAEYGRKSPEALKGTYKPGKAAKK